MSIVHRITDEAVRVSSCVEADGSWRITFVGGTNEGNLAASKLARAYLAANGITRGGFVRFGSAGASVRWSVNEHNCARVFRQLLVFPASASASAVAVAS